MAMYDRAAEIYLERITRAYSPSAKHAAPDRLRCRRTSGSRIKAMAEGCMQVARQSDREREHRRVDGDEAAAADGEAASRVAQLMQSLTAAADAVEAVEAPAEAPAEAPSPRAVKKAKASVRVSRLRKLAASIDFTATVEELLPIRNGGAKITEMQPKRLAKSANVSTAVTRKRPPAAMRADVLTAMQFRRDRRAPGRLRELTARRRGRRRLRHVTPPAELSGACKVANKHVN